MKKEKKKPITFEQFGIKHIPDAPMLPKHNKVLAVLPFVEVGKMSHSRRQHNQ